MADPTTAWLNALAFLGGGFLAGWFCRALVETRLWFFDDYRRRMGPPRGSYGNCVPMPPSTPAPGYRRVYYDMPSTIAECGGPCTAGPKHCDCGALWVDVLK